MARRLALLIALLAAAPAQAASVRVAVHRPDPGDKESPPDAIAQTVHFQAAPGERNRPRIRRFSPRRVVVSDPGARVWPGRHCRARGRHAVDCRLLPSRFDVRFKLRLGDEADRFLQRERLIGGVFGGPGDDVLAATGGALTGGPGADVLRGGRLADTLSGGPGDDELTGAASVDLLDGGTGRDVVRAGGGNDVIRTSDTERDGLFGGPANDTVDYSSSPRPVTAVLGSGAGDDDLVGIENLWGSGFDDALTGDASANAMMGGAGADTIDAGAGNDGILPDEDDDVTCGDGRDRADTNLPGDFLLRPDCERAGTYGFDVLPAQPLAVNPDAVTMSLPCDTRDAEATLTTPATARSWFASGPFGVVVATGTVPGRRPPGVCETTLALTDAGRSLARPIPVTVRVANASTRRWTFLLSPPAR